MEDWKQGIKNNNFPITQQEAEKMFRAIDADGDNGTPSRTQTHTPTHTRRPQLTPLPTPTTNPRAGLTYTEVVQVLEPATRTSFENGIMSESELAKMAGFQSFTTQQANHFLASDAKLGDKGLGGSLESHKPPTPVPQTELDAEEQEAIVNKVRMV